MASDPYILEGCKIRGSRTETTSSRRHSWTMFIHDWIITPLPARREGKNPRLRLQPASTSAGALADAGGDCALALSWASGVNTGDGVGSVM